MPAHGGLGKDVGPGAGVLLEGAANDLFRVTEAIDGCGVDPIDAEVEGSLDCFDGFAVFLVAPGEFPIAAANGPCAEADGGEVKVGVAEGAEGCAGHRQRINASR